MLKKLLLILLLQCSVGIYSFSGVFAKLASGQPVFSTSFIGYYALELVCLFIYAILWQQFLKRLDLAVAYANRAAAILWMIIWSRFFFDETITRQNIFGIAFILAGILLINSDGIGTRKEDEGLSATIS